jgi:sugar phosphate permease
MFVVNGGVYGVSAPIWGWLCDRNADPRMVNTIGTGFVAISFIFLGPVPFVPIPSSLGLCIFSLVINGVGFAAILVSGFSLAHREAVAFGFPDNLVRLLTRLQ